MNFRKKIELFTNRGSKYFCPFCGYRSKRLRLIGKSLPVVEQKEITGAGQRYGGCLKCGSTDRERLVFAYLKHEMALFENPEKFKVLHIAPEYHLSRLMLGLNMKRYDCGDLFTEGYSYEKHVANMDILSIPKPDKAYNLIICNHVLEHIADDSFAMKELNRVLDDSGRAILQVPIATNVKDTLEDPMIISADDREKYYTRHDHVRLYGLDYKERLETVGFKVDIVNISSKYPQYGLQDKENIYVAFKG